MTGGGGVACVGSSSLLLALFPLFFPLGVVERERGGLGVALSSSGGGVGAASGAARWSG